MTAGSLSSGPVGIATGLRVPLANAHLDQLVNAVAAHARRREQAGGFVSAEDAAKRYWEQDNALYEVADSISSERRANAGQAGQFVPQLLDAVHGHREWRQLTHAYRDFDDLARQHRERDVALHCVAAVARSESARSEGAGVAVDPEMVDAILSGHKTVVRTPVEFTRAGKCVRMHYKLNIGDGSTYPLVASSGMPVAECEVVPGCRLQIVSARMESLGDVTDDEALLEGLENRLAYLDRWWQRHGKYLFAWNVWRYEFEVLWL